MGGTFTIPLWEVLTITDDIGLNDYPIFDEAYRPALNRKITRHFWNQEIGQETISMFRLAMSRLMDEVMPYYNDQFRLSKLTVDPLSTVDVRSLVDSKSVNESEGNVTATTDSDAKSRAVASTNPQMALKANSDYADSSQDSISESKGTSNNADTRTDNNSGTVENITTGYNGHAPELIRATRATLVNVDLMILNEIESAGLFMMIYSIPDSFINPKGFLNGYY